MSHPPATIVATATSLRLAGPADRFRVSTHGADMIIRIATSDAGQAEAIAFELAEQLATGTARLTLERT
ncbi:hypothetical protein [Ferrovibrio sp.]|uniref:hypothetical protein n=1 Tax=Ferrovibrio sp. TaxID=1917215 RepID=UPI003D12777E